MKIQSQLTLAALFAAVLFTAGCQQMSQMTGQQAAAAPAAPTAPADTAPAAPAESAKDANYHCHEEAPACATKCHSHPGATPGHKHVYGCVNGGKRPAGGAAMPEVKAKGVYKGAVKMNKSAKQMMQKYQK